MKDINSIQWTPEAVVNREEEWLNSNNPSFINANNQIRGFPFGLFVLRRNQNLNGNSVSRIALNVKKIVIIFFLILSKF